MTPCPSSSAPSPRGRRKVRGVNGLSPIYARLSNVSINVASRIWFDKLPPDLQKVVMDAGSSVTRDIFPFSVQNYKDYVGIWVKNGGEITTLSAVEQAEITGLMAPFGAEVTAKRPEEKAMFELLVKVAKKHE